MKDLKNEGELPFDGLCARDKKEYNDFMPVAI
jgi:hypothetical protein